MNICEATAQKKRCRHEEVLTSIACIPLHLFLNHNIESYEAMCSCFFCCCCCYGYLRFTFASYALCIVSECGCNFFVRFFFSIYTFRLVYFYDITMALYYTCSFNVMFTHIYSNQTNNGALNRGKHRRNIGKNTRRCSFYNLCLFERKWCCACPIRRVCICDMRILGTKRNRIWKKTREKKHWTLLI